MGIIHKKQSLNKADDQKRDKPSKHACRTLTLNLEGSLTIPGSRELKEMLRESDKT